MSLTETNIISKPDLSVLLDTLVKLVNQITTTVPKAQQPFNVRCISVEDYAIWLGEPDAIDNIKRWMNKNLPAKTCPTYINPDDIVRVGGKAKIRFCEVPYKGISYPRFIEKKAN